VEHNIDDPKKLGRWTGQCLKLKNYSKLHIITAYRPCIDSRPHKKLFTRRTIFQQEVLLWLLGIEDPNPRQIFLDDLKSIVNIITVDPENHLILMIDANEPSTSKSGITQFFQDTYLVDI
jgi:hypothetical protein